MGFAIACTVAIEEIDRQVKVLIKNLAIFFLCPSKQYSTFLSILFQIQLLEYFPQKQKEQGHKQQKYSDKLAGYHTYWEAYNF